MSDNIIPHSYSIKSNQRSQHSQCRPSVIWLTGLSGSGKSTIANLVDQQLFRMGVRSYFLDGDNLRSGLNQDLGFSNDDRMENIRRVAEVSKLFIDSGSLLFCSFISPSNEIRSLAREIVGRDFFHEVYIQCKLSTCEARDPKGLYKKARQGLIPQFTGIDSPFEEPASPDLLIKNDDGDASTAAQMLVQYLKTKKIVF